MQGGLEEWSLEAAQSDIQWRQQLRERKVHILRYLKNDEFVFSGTQFK